MSAEGWRTETLIRLLRSGGTAFPYLKFFYRPPTGIAAGINSVYELSGAERKGLKQVPVVIETINRLNKWF